MRLNLSLQFSIASIYFSNGSFADIAKIEGGPAYKQMIRATDILKDMSKLGTGAIQAPLRLQSLRDYLPPWLGGKNARTQSLSRMLEALKTATESYLETSLSTAEVVMPFPVSNSYLHDLRSACSYLSLHMPLSAQPPAGILAARAHGIGGNCPSDTASKVSREQWDDPEQLILTIDYSRAALTALLVAEECSTFEYRRVLHDTRLGTDGLFRGSDSSGPDSSRDDLARALRKLTSLPLEDGNGEGLKQISELVLLGESASDRRLHDVLMEVLAEQSGSLVTAAYDERPRVIDPLFAASRGVAYDCWDRMNFKEHNVEL